VDYINAHGTSTNIGDAASATTLGLPVYMLRTCVRNDIREILTSHRQLSVPGLSLRAARRKHFRMLSLDGKERSRVSAGGTLGHPLNAVLGYSQLLEQNTARPLTESTRSPFCSPARAASRAPASPPRARP